MSEYTFEYGKRTVIKDGIVYISTDLVGRVRVPSSLIRPDLRTKKCTVAYDGENVILDYNENQPENKSKGGRVTIPTTIRAVLRLKRNDYFRVERNPEGTHFVLKIATDELTLEDLEGITDEQSEE